MARNAFLSEFMTCRSDLSTTSAWRIGTVRREQVCIMEIWCECFGKNREAIKKSDSYEIEGILNRIGGWTKFTGNKTGKKNLALYGPQRIFVRTYDVPK